MFDRTAIARSTTHERDSRRVAFAGFGALGILAFGFALIAGQARADLNTDPGAHLLNTGYGVTGEFAMPEEADAGAEDSLPGADQVDAPATLKTAHPGTHVEPHPEPTRDQQDGDAPSPGETGKAPRPTEAHALSKAAPQKPTAVVRVTSADKLSDLFRRIGYRLDHVHEYGAVPPVLLASLPRDFRRIDAGPRRKQMFIKTVLPLILHANDQILADRARLIALRDRIEEGETIASEDSQWLARMVDGYGLDRKSPAAVIGEIDFYALLRRVDAVPPSLAIAQAAEESGWGTSRFAREGNALFGQRTYRGGRPGLVPKARPKGKTFKVRAFDQLADGVMAYMVNLNTHWAYDDFRAARAEMRRTGTGGLNGHALAGTLKNYSERGGDYIRGIRALMRYNRLSRYDHVTFDDLPVLPSDAELNPPNRYFPGA